mgnify:CR=1 FL=1
MAILGGWLLAVGALARATVWPLGESQPPAAPAAAGAGEGPGGPAGAGLASVPEVQRTTSGSRFIRLPSGPGRHRSRACRCR